jgi:hypothetical protein
MLLGQVYVADDLGEFHLPLRAFYSQQLQRGEPFDWISSLYGGFYLSGEGQLGAYHPLHQALYRWLPLGLAFDLELLLSYPLMFAGTYGLLVRLVRRSDAALFGAMVFTFSGFNLLHFVHPNAVAIVAHLPWLLLCVDVALRSCQRRQVALAEAAAALLLASQLLLGYPQYVWLSLLAVVAYAAYRRWRAQASVARLGLLAWSFGLAALCAAVQLAPTYDLLSSSVRGTADPSFAKSGSLHPLNLVQLVAPYLFHTRVVGQNTHELATYVGAVPLVLCAWLAANRRQWGPRRPIVLLLASFAAVSLLLACGQFGGLYRLQSLLPIVNRFRFPCRAIVLVQLCVAAASALALAMLLERQADASASSQTPPAAHRRRTLGLVFAASVALALAGPRLWPDFVAASWLVWTGPLLIGLAVGGVLLMEGGARWAPAALALLTIADLSAYGLSYSVVGRTASLQQFIATTPHPPARGPFRIAAAPTDDGLRSGDRVLLGGSTRVDGYAGLEPRKRLDYRNPAALRLAGAQWLWRPAVPSWAAGPSWVRLDGAAARVRLITRTLPARALDETASLPLTAAVIEPAVELDSLADVGSVSVVADRPGWLLVDVRANGRQLLATTESYHAGWRASAAGHDLQVVRVDGDFLGCIVEPGVARIEWKFAPQSLLIGKILSCCGLGLIVFTLAFRLPLGTSRGQRDPQSCSAPRMTNC